VDGRPPPFVRQVERRRDQIVDQILTSVTRQIPIYARLPRHELDDLQATVHHGLGVIFRLVREGGTFTPADLVVFTDSAARRARDGFSLGEVLSAYQISGAVTWQAFAAAAGPGEREELLGVAEASVTKGPTAIAAVAAAFLDERLLQASDPASGRLAVAAALVRGLPAEALAVRAGIVLAPSYQVVALRVDDAEPLGGIGEFEAQRRVLERLKRWLVEDSSEEALGLLTNHDAVVLLASPAGGSDDAAGPAILDRLEAVVGQRVTAATAWRPTRAELPAAVEEARQVLQLAVVTGRPPGIYRLDDLLLETMLAQPSVVAERLVKLLGPLAEGPALLQTLEAYLTADLDRRRAAQALHIHPNTLDYRLRRIRQLTGLAPTTTQGVQVLGAALLAWRLRGDQRP
jgi:hypothetical protein